MSITSTSRRALPWVAAFTATCLVLSAALGSSGTIEGDPDTGQKIANVTFPLLFVGLLVLAAIGLVLVIARFRRS